MKRKRAGDLIRKYIAGTSTRNENRLLDDHYNKYLQSSHSEATAEEIAHARQNNHAAIIAHLQRNKGIRKNRLRLAVWTGIAATVAFVCSMLVLTHYKQQTALYADQEAAHDIAPGGSKAVLTLADGRKVDLSNAHDGIIMGDGELIYSDGTAIFSEEDPSSGTENENLPALYYVLSTPNGGIYQITLSDGTRVWLNAASTLKYPSRFNTDKREVYLEGEAYFAVDSRQPAVKKPFIVTSGSQETIVLGTEFNINAYPDEPEIKTTLVNGAVKVMALKNSAAAQPLTSDHQSLLLNPGQQSTLSATGLRMKAIDAESEVAWKAGKFHFNDTPFDVMIRQLARWYDVEVQYGLEGTPDIRFSGEIGRHVTLRTLLSFLEEMGVSIHLKNKTLIIG